MTDIQNHDPRDEERLDRALDLLRSSEPEPGVADAAAERVWARLQAAARSEGGPALVAVETLEGCDDVQALIPDFLAGRLSESRALLLRDHTRECIPCRKVLQTARDGKSSDDLVREAPRQAAEADVHWTRWAVAAALVTALGAGMLVVKSLWPAGPAGAVQTVDGDLFRVHDDLQVPIHDGDELLGGEIVRTGRGSGAVLRLEDGSLVEMRERSELAVREGRKGTTIDLQRGAVIVQAAPQDRGRLFVATDDCEVAVKGTIFSVDHGTRGSRVAVIEGEVEVRHDGSRDLLHPGDLVSTQEAQLGSPAVAREIAWSRDVDRYLELLEAYDGLERDLREQVLPPGLRYSSRILDVVPPDTVLYAALPNLGDTIAETHRIALEQVRENPVLAQWWAEGRVGEIEEWTEDIVARLEELGSVLGEEIVFTGQSLPDDEFDGPIVLAEIVDSAGLRDLIERTWAEIDAEHGGEADLILVEDPSILPAGDDALWVWISESHGLLIATPQGARLQQVAGYLDGTDNPFVGSAFHGRLAELYDEGAEILVGVDLENAMPGGDSEAAAEMDRLGVTDARHLIVEQKAASDKVHHRAVVTFSGERRGLASWLAEPAPMGSLEFVSPEATLAGAAVFKDPIALFDDIQGFAGTENGASGLFSHFRDEYGIDLRDDVAGALGGELAFAVDGPLLPTPAWKMVLETYDSARIQWALEQAVAEANVHLAQNGEPTLEIVESGVGGRTWYALETSKLSVHYTFDSGYWLLGANRAIVERAIQYRDSGFSITESAKFRNLMPADGRNNFSFVLYHDLGGLVESLAEKLAQGQLSEEQQATLERVRGANGPGLGYAYGEPDRIIVATASETDVLRSAVLQALGLRNPAGMAELLPQIFAGI